MSRERTGRSPFVPKLDDLKFRQNVKPEKRRWANKTLSEFDSVEAAFKNAEELHRKATENSNREAHKLKIAQNQFNLVRNNS
jgi:hypothetical protein